MLQYRLIATVFLLAGSASFASAEDAKPQPAPPFGYDRKTDVIYGRLPGVALTMDVFSPKPDAKVKANRAGVIWVVSGGWASAQESIDGKFFGSSIREMFLQPLIARGYTVFAVVHGSQPKYTITEILPQINRAVRYIRTNAKDFGIDGNRLGIIGASAGGHLSLMQGLSPMPANDKSPDPVDHAGSEIQAVAAFVPPTDFLNYGGPGINGLGNGPLDWLKAPFDFQETKMIPARFGAGQQPVFAKITDEEKLAEIGHAISPIYHVDAKDPPVLVLAGEVDRLVPLQQMQSLKEKLDEAKVPNELIVRKGADHAWPEMGQDMQKVADWYDKHLLGDADKK